MNQVNGVSRCGRVCKKSSKLLRDASPSAAHTTTTKRVDGHHRIRLLQQRTAPKSASAFSLWAKEQRQYTRLHSATSDPTAERRPPLKKLWSKLSNAVKNIWRRRSRLLHSKPRKVRTLLADTASRRPTTTAEAAAEPLRSDQIVLSECTPSNAAAHLLLLGESLQTMGESLMQHEGHISVTGTLSVLLDMFLCSMGPLMALTKEIPNTEENPHLDAAISSTLDNIAYILPGLQ